MNERAKGIIWTLVAVVWAATAMTQNGENGRLRRAERLSFGRNNTLCRHLPIHRVITFQFFLTNGQPTSRLSVCWQNNTRRAWRWHSPHTPCPQTGVNHQATRRRVADGKIAGCSRNSRKTRSARLIMAKRGTGHTILSDGMTRHATLLSQLLSCVISHADIHRPADITYSS